MSGLGLKTHVVVVPEWGERDKGKMPMGKRKP
jgi:hypothetical protein